jgi:hypothetical protein
MLNVVGNDGNDLVHILLDNAHTTAPEQVDHRPTQGACPSFDVFPFFYLCPKSFDLHFAH